MVNEEIRALFRGRPLYIVGGYVRDYLLGRESRDIDLVYEGDAIAMAREISSKWDLKSYRENPKYLSASFSFMNYDFTITSAREENAEGCWISSLMQDFKRRDFTINAIAYDLERDEFLDPLNGMKDLEKRVLRRVASLYEDPSRILRGVRLKLELKLSIDPQTEREMMSALPGLKERNSRIKSEMIKLLKMREDDPLLKEVFITLGCRPIGMNANYREKVALIKRDFGNSDLARILS